MSRIRIFKSSSMYPRHCRRFYEEHPELEKRCWSDQIAEILADGFSFGDAWKHYLEATGKYDVIETITNAEPAQKRWAKDNGVRWTEDAWSSEILEAQLQHYRPDVWFCHGAMDAESRLRMRRACPSVRCTIGYDGVLKHSPAAFAGCDVMLSCLEQTSEFYRASGLIGHWMRWGFDPRLLPRLEPQEGRFFVSFCGSIAMQSHVGHFERPKLLARLEREFDLRVFSGELQEGVAERLMLSHVYRCKWRVAVKTARIYPSIRRLRLVNGTERFGLAMLQTLRDTAVSLNLHVAGTTSAANIRMFEVTGVGSCLLTDWKDNLPDLFEPDREIVAFRSHDECAEKLRYLRDHERERMAIAAAGHERCLRDHNMGHHILGFADQVLARL